MKESFYKFIIQAIAISIFIALTWQGVFFIAILIYVAIVMWLTKIFNSEFNKDDD